MDSSSRKKKSQNVAYTEFKDDCKPVYDVDVTKRAMHIPTVARITSNTGGYSLGHVTSAFALTPARFDSDDAGSARSQQLRKVCLNVVNFIIGAQT